MVGGEFGSFGSSRSVASGGGQRNQTGPMGSMTVTVKVHHSALPGRVLGAVEDGRATDREYLAGGVVAPDVHDAAVIAEQGFVPPHARMTTIHVVRVGDDVGRTVLPVGLLDVVHEDVEVAIRLRSAVGRRGAHRRGADRERKRAFDRLIEDAGVSNGGRSQWCTRA